MTTRRWLAAIAKSGEVGHPMIAVSGGVTADGVDLDTAEIFTESGWAQLSQRLPVKIREHCSVFRSDSRLMLVAGNQNGQKSARTYYFDFEVLHFRDTNKHMSEN